VIPERGQGAKIWDTEGREFLDFTMAWGSALVGHAHPKVVEAAATAARDGVNFASLNRRSIELAERIASVSPCAERIRFVASGTEATLLCLRVAHTATGRPKVLRFEGAYHGQHAVGVAGMIHSRPTDLPTCDTAGAGAPWAERDVLVAPYNDLEGTTRILEAHAPSLAAVIVEPMAGSTGVLPPPKGYLKRLREICDKHGILLIFDEVITGFGRLGHAFAAERFGVTPDILTFAKGVTSGTVPMGGCMVRQGIYDKFMNGPDHVIELFHGYTYTGHPMAAAAGVATMDLYRDEQLFENAKKLENVWADAAFTLKGHPLVEDIRTLGLVAAIDLKPIEGSPGLRAYKAMENGFHDVGMLMRITADTIALSPPLIINENQIDEIFSDKMPKILASVS
jgi:beta-alanine--pyruvate transaminase